VHLQHCVVLLCPVHIVFFNLVIVMKFSCYHSDDAVCRSSAHQAGVGTIFDRVLTELVSKMREMKMDKTELGALKAIVLFNPGETLFLAV